MPSTAASLGEAVTSALTAADQAPRVAALRDQGDAIRSQATSPIASDPDLRLKLLSDRLNSDTGAYELEAMLDLPLWLPGQRDARRALAESLGLRADQLAKYLRWEMAGEVRETAWEAELAHGRLRRSSAALQTARSLESTVRKRVDAGELARLDLLLASQETAARQADLAAAQLDYNQAIAAYVLLTSQPRLPEPLIETAPPALPTDIGAVTLPPDHPLLASADSAVAEARAARDRVESERRGHPLLSFGGKRARADRAERSVDALQLELSMPFGLKRQAAPELAGAERELTDRKAALHRVRREAERALRRAVLTRRGAREALALAQEHADLAGEALALARRAFDLGELNLAALLRAQERARNARLALELRRLEQGRAIARLNQAYGVVPQ